MNLGQSLTNQNEFSREFRQRMDGKLKQAIPNSFIRKKKLSELTTNQEIYNQSFKPHFISKSLPDDHIYEWERIQLMRSQPVDDRILGGKYRYFMK